MKVPDTAKRISVRIFDRAKAKTTDGEIRVQFWNKRERMARALKWGGLCWLASLVSVILPLAHFILVPGFFLAGPAVAFFLMRQESVILGGEGKCPRCEEVLPIVRSSYRFPLSDLCTRCQTPVDIEPASSS